METDMVVSTRSQPWARWTTLLVSVGLALNLGGARPKESLPWAEAGMDEREAAAFLLDRFTFGPRPGEVDRVLAMGMESWLDAQLWLAFEEPDLDRLRDLPTLDLSATQIAETYPNGGLILRQARREGLLGEGDAPQESLRDPGTRRALLAFAEGKGYRRQGELTHDLLTQKVYRAVHADNQLGEVLTDFWFNHFNVSLTDPETRAYLLPYERDAIRPHVLGTFRAMLGATASSPAMLLYLDNARSSAAEGAPTTLEARRPARAGYGHGRWGRGRNRSAGADSRPRGLNENYARELLELHTLGVDGGYTQGDVVEVARAFSGWTVLPPAPVREDAMARLAMAERYGRQIGFERHGDFIFRPDAHDAGPKKVLGVKLSPGGGIEDGEAVLDIVAAHPSTAHHIASKLAVRFVSDEPPVELVDRLAGVFAETDGDLRSMVRALAYSPELWEPAARHQKIKSPFELTVSAVRAVGGKVEEAAGLVDWIARMGQPLYAHQAPTGYPDRAAAWVSSGALLARMNFGLALASGLVPGVRIDLPGLVGSRQPESVAAALAAYCSVLLPERELDAAVARLGPIVSDPELAAQVSGRDRSTRLPTMETDERVRQWENPFPRYRRDRMERIADTSTEAQVVGVILGSPEFQRR